MGNILNVSNRQEFRSWLMEHAAHELECWVDVKRGKPADPEIYEKMLEHLIRETKKAGSSVNGMIMAGC